MDFSSLKEWLELASSLASAFGIPVAIWLFVRDRRRECRTRTLEAYLETNNQYNAFLDRVFDHPELDCGEFRAADKEAATPGMSVQKMTLFTQLTMTLERPHAIPKTICSGSGEPGKKSLIFGLNGMIFNRPGP